MDDGIMLIIGDDGIARSYDDTYDITIHCESQEEQNEVKRRLTVPQWIPVSERLPEEDMWTICQNNAGAMMIGKYDIEFGWMFPAYFDGIVAWMPRPEPYKPYKEVDA